MNCGYIEIATNSFSATSDSSISTRDKDETGGERRGQNIFM